jgi:hypothetical protein
MPERLGEQPLVLDDQDAEHDRLASPQPARFFTESRKKGIHGRRICGERFRGCAEPT